jgi:hypothetical protein
MDLPSRKIDKHRGKPVRCAVAAMFARAPEPLGRRSTIDSADGQLQLSAIPVAIPLAFSKNDGTFLLHWEFCQDAFPFLLLRTFCFRLSRNLLANLANCLIDSFAET